jgi:hypothetical protein
MEEMHGTFLSKYDETFCRKFSGPYFDELRASYTATLAAIRHPDARARWGALTMLETYWPQGPEFPQVSEQLAVGDGDLEVRCRAISCLGQYYSDSHDPRISARFVGIIIDDSQPRPCRFFAYLGLLALMGRHGAQEADLRTFRIPDDIDWAFVEQCRWTESGVEDA